MLRGLGAFLFSPQLIERVKVLLREPHSVSACRPPNVAGHAAPQELAAFVYLGEGPLAFMATVGAFLGHYGRVPRQRAKIVP
jgi:hypothetical protein